MPTTKGKTDVTASRGKPRLVLLTTGLRPLAMKFTCLVGQPTGIVSWHGGSSGRLVDALAFVPPLARLYARLRGRQYASLAHFCRLNNLEYACIRKDHVDVLKHVLSRWDADLVITSGCPMVPMQALEGVKHGGLNIHPSLLPAYRGADPLSWQVVDQVKNVGVTVHRLSERYDEGQILAQSQILRGRGKSRQQMTQELEGEIGYTLLSELVAKLAVGEELTEREQPQTSPTRLARKLTVHGIGDVWQLNDLAAETVWDIIRFYDQCPPQWLALSGWRKLVKWRPISFKHVDGYDSLGVSSQWRVKYAGTSILLMHQTAIIELKTFASRQGCESR